ncbi:hypothetical protein [Sphingosinicella terrae]|uniref:hypothetical protein n=1 Tax=Sphingosinicella terrae TaxID=2172047 RepID=UPI000E0D044D|nr:hypothetical protein [Sphingosinicella terrae]
MRSARAAISVFAAIALTGAAEGPETLVVSGDGIVAATVNDAPGRIRIDPAAPSMAVLDQEWAGRAGLRRGMVGFGYLVGPHRIDGSSAVARIAVGEGAQARRRRVGFGARPFTRAADGVIGPGGLPQPVISFVLRDPLPGERTVSLPMADEGGLFGGWGGIYALVELGGEPLRIRFDPHHPRTLATAGAGVRIAEAQDGTMSGAAEPVEIAFGIERPVRTLRLARPFAVGPLALTSLGVRTADFGNAGSIREEDADPDEIIVTGRRGRDTSRDRLSIGADALGRCSSITFDKPGRAIRLTCA